MTIKIPETDTIRYNLNINKIFILNYLFKNKKGDVNSVYEEYSFLIPSKRVIRENLSELTEEGFCVKHNTFGSESGNNYEYSLTKKGKDIFSEVDPKYTVEQFMIATGIISHWNSIESTTTHSVKPYDKKQTSTVRYCINFILNSFEGKYPKDIKVIRDEKPLDSGLPKLRKEDYIRMIDLFKLKLSDKYLPKNKYVLPTTFKDFLCKYGTCHSELLYLYYNGVKEDSKTIDELKTTGISGAMLKKAYEVLSETGKATQEEKLVIQRSIVRMYSNYVERRKELDVLYGNKKEYCDRVKSYNMFMYELLSYIDREIGVGKAKPGFISFREGNKVMEKFSSYMATKHNIYLWPSAKKKEELMKNIS